MTILSAHKYLIGTSKAVLYRISWKDQKAVKLFGKIAISRPQPERQRTSNATATIELVEHSFNKTATFGAFR